MSQGFSARKLLLPLVPAYRLGLWWRTRGLESGAEPVKRLSFPVVSIGNLSTGGTGKTPLAIALAKALTERGLRVDVLSRGYGREGQFPARVDPGGTAQEFGDEPLLMAREARVQVYVARQRYEAGLLAEKDAQASGVEGEKAKPKVHLLDDGFQHRQLARDVDILLLNREDWEDQLLPAGNLREPVAAARRASVIAISADDSDLEKELRAWGWDGPLWRLRRRMDVPAIDGPVAAFCGIARPEQFFAGLAASGMSLAIRRAFADHHRYSASDVDRLMATARGAGACALVTSVKDLVRMGKLSSHFPETLPIIVAGLRVVIEDENAVVEWLIEHLRQGLERRSL
jgi:tetraacyldisaccharide 4'-kinase